MVVFVDRGFYYIAFCIILRRNTFVLIAAFITLIVSILQELVFRVFCVGSILNRDTGLEFQQCKNSAEL